MTTTPQQALDLDHVLRVFGRASTDAWCYAPSTAGAIPRITHYSSEFLALFRVEPPSSFATIGISFMADDPRLTAGSVMLGLPADWLTERLSTDVDTPPNLTHTNELRITEKQLQDSAGTVSGKLLFFSTTVGLDSMRTAFRRAREAKRDLAVLSNREAEILELVFSGLTNKAVANQANISEKTVEKHRANIMRKLQVKNSAGLIRRVTEASMISDE